MNRFSEQWSEVQAQQKIRKLDLANKLEEVGVTIIEPEKFKLDDLQELYDKHFAVVNKLGPKKGRYLNYREIADLAGVNYSTFVDRINKGYSVEKAILGQPENYLTYKEMAELAGIPYQTLIHRLRRGNTLEQALTEKKKKKQAAVKLRRNEMDRRERKKRRMEILMQLNTLEQKNGDPEIIARLERELANV